MQSMDFMVDATAPRPFNPLRTNRLTLRERIAVLSFGPDLHVGWITRPLQNRLIKAARRAAAIQQHAARAGSGAPFGSDLRAGWITIGQTPANRLVKAARRAAVIQQHVSRGYFCSIFIIFNQ
jgi:hypothetical protein